MANPVSLDDLATAVTGRTTSLFEEAFEAVRTQLAERVTGKNLIFTGGAGFIATQTLKILLPFEPRVVTVVDSSENALAELVRDLRSTGQLRASTRIEPRLVDITSPLVDRLWNDLDPIDAAFEFAAAKHVRTERDPVSLLRMLQVNLNGTAQFTHSLVEANPDAEIFVVSTDKAADPSSLMGASKRLMELAILGTYPRATSTRFANVAFSSGSLLESWVIRMRQNQPLAVPRDTWRFFVSPREAGQICAIASVAGPGSISVPDEEATGLVELEAALERVLDASGMQPVRVSEAEALDGATFASDHVPVVVSQRDTAGEKRAEKFVAGGEERREWLPQVGLIATNNDPEPANQMREWVAGRITSATPELTVELIADAVRQALPGFCHITSDKRLDDRL